MKSFLLKSIALVLSAFGAAQSAYVCSDNVVTTAAKTDFLFLIDTSPSMSDYIRGVTAGLTSFAQQVANNGLDATFAIVGFGGNPTIYLPVTSDFNQFYNSMRGINANTGGQEAGLEALRASLKNNGGDMAKNCAKSIAKQNCVLRFRDGATKIFILVTDEDSDLPMLSSYREPGQAASSSFCVNGVYRGSCINGQYEPPFNAILSTDPGIGGSYSYYFRNETRMRMNEPYENELRNTAALLAQNNVFLNLLVGSDIGVGSGGDFATWPVSVYAYEDNGKRKNVVFQQQKSRNPSLQPNFETVAYYQYGDPALQSQNADFTGFNTNMTLTRLVNAGLQNSLQARMLAGGNFARVYDVANFASSDGSTSKIISAFYSQIVATTSYISQQCVFVPDPVSTTTSSTVAATSSTSSSVSSSTSTISSSSSVSTSTSTSSSSSSSSSTAPATSSSSIASSTSVSSSTSTTASSTSTSSSTSTTASSTSTSSSTSATTSSTVNSSSSSSSATTTSSTPSTSSSSSSTSSASISSESSSLPVSSSSSSTTTASSTSTTVSSTSSATSSSTSIETTSASSSSDSSVASTSTDSASVSTSTDAASVSTSTDSATVSTDPATSTEESTSTTDEPSSTDEAAPTNGYYFYYNAEGAIFKAIRSSQSAAAAGPAPQEAPQSQPTQNSTTAAIAGASVGAAAIGSAALGIFLRRKRAAANLALGFENQDGSAAVNPLYAGQTSVAENPLFEKPTVA